jgi:hypothetical protein
MKDRKHQTIRHGIDKDSDGYKVAATGLTRPEVIELLIAIRRLELFRLMDVDVDVVETSARTMAEFEEKTQERGKMHANKDHTEQ